MAETLNLVDMVKEHLTGDFGNKVSSLLGESRDKTQLGINAAVPGILAGFANTASKADGARLLASAVDNADDGILSSIGSMFGRSTDSGTGALRSILGGGGLSELSGNIGRTSGLTGKGVMTLLGLVAPIVMGVLRSLKFTRGLDSSGLASLLSSQRDNIAAAMPAGMGESSYREPIREVTEETYGARPASRARATETYSAAPAEHRKSSSGWILPLLLLAGLIGMIWIWSSNRTVRAGREDTKVTEQAPRLKGSPMLSLEALKAKYNSVIESARHQGVQISSLTQRDGKLVVQGTAPSAEVADRVKEQFRRINPSMNDVIVEVSVDSSLAPTTSSKESVTKSTEAEKSVGKATDEDISRAKPTEKAAGSEVYIVKPGDTLGKISKHFYGTAKDYKRILNENKSQLKDANTLSVGQKLEIPMK